MKGSQNSTWPKAQYMKWEFFQQSLGMKKESGEEQLKELKALSDLQFMRDNVTKESVQTAQFSYPPLKALQAVRIGQLLDICTGKKASIPSKPCNPPLPKRQKTDSAGSSSALATPKPTSASAATKLKEPPPKANSTLKANSPAPKANSTNTKPLALKQNSAVAKPDTTVPKSHAAAPKPGSGTLKPDVKATKPTAVISKPSNVTPKSNPAMLKPNTATPNLNMPGSSTPLPGLMSDIAANLAKAVKQTLEGSEHASSNVLMSAGSQSKPAAQSNGTKKLQTAKPVPADGSRVPSLASPVHKSLSATSSAGDTKAFPGISKRPLPGQKAHSADASPSSVSLVSEPPHKRRVLTVPPAKTTWYSTQTSIQAIDPQTRASKHDTLPKPSQAPRATQTSIATSSPAQPLSSQTSQMPHVPATKPSSQPAKNAHPVQSSQAPAVSKPRAQAYKSPAPQKQPAERQSAQASPVSAEAGTAPKPAATAIEMAKHASDCINSAAGMLQIIELFVKKGMPMPDNLRQVMSRTMEQSVAQVKLRTDQQSSSEARP
ncbi:hypothetical protein LPJ55_004478 [Coemansia sp. RSA 990]|nr:hypothetical protein LPJ55_004478 [Coemansia sp. RSA 990]